MSRTKVFTTIGAAIAHARAHEGLSMHQLATACGCSVAHISRVERNLKLPSIPLLFTIATVTGFDFIVTATGKYGTR